MKLKITFLKGSKLHRILHLIGNSILELLTLSRKQNTSSIVVYMFDVNVL